MELASKDSCTGCGNCGLVCKKKAVTFTRDALNNIYPVIDSSKCVECGLCQKVCSAINQVEKNSPKACYSCYATNEAIRKSSASGGVAQAIYRWCLKNDIPFAGVYFDNKELTAKYKLGFSEEDIHQFVNSKYTFSFMGSISEDVIDILKNGKSLVFIGLPCQVAAVKKYAEIKKVNTENLFTVDIICHGVPSDLYIKEHVKNICNGGAEIDRLSFRDERFMTSKFVFSVDYNGKNYHKYVESNDNFQIGYHNATIYRPNCYSCMYAGPNRCGDLTIGDFTGLGRVASVDGNIAEMKYQGVSCVLCNSEKGQKFLAQIGNEKYLSIDSRPIEEALKFENQLANPSTPSAYRNRFVELYPEKGFDKACDSVFRKEKLKRPIIHAAKMCVKKVLGRR